MNTRNLKAQAEKNGIPFNTCIDSFDWVYDSYATIFPYHDYVILAKMHPETNDECTSAVYRFDTDEHGIDDPCTLVSLDYRAFHDCGEAVKHGITVADEMMESYDDPIEFLINYTEPCENPTLADMEKLLSQSVADGWNFSPSITPQKLLEIYEDLEPQEGEL